MLKKTRQNKRNVLFVLCSSRESEVKNEEKFLDFYSDSCAVSLVGTAILYNMDRSVLGNAPNGHDENYAFGQLNVKARAVNEGGGATAVGHLVDEMFLTYNVAGVPVDVKSRIVNAEMQYQNQQRGGVAEVEIVEAINGLQLRFDTPEFSMTDLYEVRKLRQSLQLRAPQFVGHGRQSEQSFVNNVNPTIVPEMSPSEAVFVLIAMAYQKVSNPNYQLTLAERNAMWNENHSTKIGQGLESDPVKVQQITHAVVDELQTISETEALAIAHRALDILGI